MDSLVLQGIELVRGFQSLGGWLKLPMLFFTFLGTEEFYIIVVPAIFWCVDRALGIELVTLLLVSSGTNELAKSVFKLPRPYWVEPKLALSTDVSFGLPSGHAESAVALWGYLAAILRSSWRWLCVLLILLISLSRLYLGVHFPADILAGWALGLLVLAGFFWLKPRLAPRLRTWPLRVHVASAVVVSAVVLGLYLVAAMVPSGQPATYGALYAVAHAHIYEVAGALAGMILGAWIGLAVEERVVRFSPDGTRLQRSLRLVIGLVVLVALRFGLKAIFPEDPLALGLAFRAMRYALMMLWAALAWPWLFVRLGLAKSEYVTST
jgi:membrane-associated phospholipid phosphatase